MAELFRGIFDAEGATVISVGKFLLCVGVALFIGVILTAAYLFRSRYTRSFVITLSLLPAVVSVIIMMVNGNIGAGVAVAGHSAWSASVLCQGLQKKLALCSSPWGRG